MWNWRSIYQENMSIISSCANEGPFGLLHIPLWGVKLAGVKRQPCAQWPTQGASLLCPNKGHWYSRHMYNYSVTNKIIVFFYLLMNFLLHKRRMSENKRIAIPDVMNLINFSIWLCYIQFILQFLFMSYKLIF